MFGPVSQGGASLYMMRCSMMRETYLLEFRSRLSLGTRQASFWARSVPEAVCQPDC